MDIAKSNVQRLPVGKGIRGAPRDALVADIAPPNARGAAFGLRQALDTVGAVLGRCWQWGWPVCCGTAGSILDIPWWRNYQPVCPAGSDLPAYLPTCLPAGQPGAVD